MFQADIIKLLIGGEGDIEPLYSARVAAYGTGNVSHPADWAPLLVADAPLPTATQVVKTFWQSCEKRFRKTLFINS